MYNFMYGQLSTKGMLVVGLVGLLSILGREICICMFKDFHIQRNSKVKIHGFSFFTYLTLLQTQLQ